MDLVEINPGAASFPAAERPAEMSRGWPASRARRGAAALLDARGRPQPEALLADRPARRRGRPLRPRQADHVRACPPEGGPPEACPPECLLDRALLDPALTEGEPPPREASLSLKKPHSLSLCSHMPATARPAADTPPHILVRNGCRHQRLPAPRERPALVRDTLRATPVRLPRHLDGLHTDTLFSYCIRDWSPVPLLDEYDNRYNRTELFL